MPLTRSPITVAHLLVMLGALSVAGALYGEALPDAEPFDTVVLQGDGANTRLEVYPLDLPSRRVPNPLPTGSFTVRPLDRPGDPLMVNWAAVKRIELFEQKLLSEAARLTREKQYVAAFDHLARLDRDYPRLPGLERAFASFLRADALARFREGEQEHALVILGSLYDRSPTAPGVRQAVDAVGGKILAGHWKQKDYRAVSATLTTLRSGFPNLKLQSLAPWQERLAEHAEEEIGKAESAIQQRDYRTARQSAMVAVELTPHDPRTQNLLARIERENPTVRVGVLETGPAAKTLRLDTPSARRLSRLTGGSLVRLDDYAPNGGVYSSPLGEVQTDDRKRQIRLRLVPTLANDGQSAYAIARAILRLGESYAGSSYHALAERAIQVSIERPSEIVIDLKRTHTRPEALLKGPLPEELALAIPAAWQLVPSTSEDRGVYQRNGNPSGFQLIEETRFSSEQAAINALLAGDIQVLANLPPWRMASMRRTTGIAVGEYRLPTLHCLFVSPDSPLASSREARRALSYGIARDKFVSDVLLGGEPSPGYQTLSAVLPLGRSLGDPLRYAYNDALTPRPYQPRLAALLSAVAAKNGEKEDETTLAASPLVLLHAPTPIARLACRSIESQLGALGIRVERIEASEADLMAGNLQHDLRYGEVTLGEPMVDAWTLFGPGGLAGDCSATLLSALQQLDAAKTGKGVSDALREAHEVLAGDLPLIPLWQTVDHYAFRRELEGLPRETVDLYQTIDEWRVNSPGRNR